MQLDPWRTSVFLLLLLLVLLFVFQYLFLLLSFFLIFLFISLFSISLYLFPWLFLFLFSITFSFFIYISFVFAFLLFYYFNFLPRVTTSHNLSEFQAHCHFFPSITGASLPASPYVSCSLTPTPPPSFFTGFSLYFFLNASFQKIFIFLKG